MQQVETKKLSAKDAVAKAFSYFDELFPESGMKHVLLEGLKYLEDADQWEVTIGFDVGRQRNGSEQLSFMSVGQEPIREFRILRIDGFDGAFVELDHT